MLMVVAIYVYIIAIIFRLLDNSAALLIRHGISVSPFYLKPPIILAQIEDLKDEKLIWKLRRNLWYQKLHIAFTALAILTLIVGIIYEIYNPYIIYLM
ncbi:hypothetical protein DCS32_07195 [Dokdonia sp. Dokd-P16]|nr:hypothetical protein DCS32_07195 [Dokdonia sp. Dokd-P16]